MVSQRECTFQSYPIGCLASAATASVHDFGNDSFHLWRPQPCGCSRMASISSAFRQQQQEQRPKAVALFSTAKAEEATGVRHDFRIVKVKPDGKCMFRALASGMSINQGFYIAGSEEEEADADALRLATADALCRSASRRGEFKEAMFSLEAEDTLGGYCQRLQQPTFWGGEVELLVLSKMLRVPITVYKSNTEAQRSGGGFAPIAKYGAEWEEGGRQGVNLLYRNGNHYDLLCA